MNWLVFNIEEFWQALLKLFTTPLFYIGSKVLSLWQIIQLLLFCVAVFIVARGISGLVKRGLLVPMGLTRGSQEAIGAILSYILGAVGSLIILQSSGIDLTSITVLAGVLGIGIGFGLQDLASNFISGLALLFEQQIRVGDFIQLDQLLGTVENISIRSTIVKTIDDQFVIIPNSKLMENNIINWSYKDIKSCLRIPINVAYGSDPVLVTEALLEAARETARKEVGVLSKPSPKVCFQGFGEGAFSFELLVWIDRPQELDEIKSDLNFKIEDKFRQRGIEIPLPQRSLWLRNPQDLKGIFNLRKPSNLTDINDSKSYHNSPNPSEFISQINGKENPTQKSPNNWTLRDLLRRITFFEHCTDLELRQLIEYGYRQLFPSGQIICQENDPGDSFYIILSGNVEVISQKTNQYIATLHDGEFFGEMSLLLGTPRTATVKTIENCVLFVVERSDLKKLLMEYPDLADQIAKRLSERQQALKDLGLFDNLPQEQTPFLKIRKQIQTLFGI
jgi:small-conductance mechanosensitive channel